MDVDNEDVTNGIKSFKDKDDLEESIEADAGSYLIWFFFKMISKTVFHTFRIKIQCF